MSEIKYFQVKVSTAIVDPKITEVIDSLGLSSERWSIENATWCEDYFDLDASEIDNGCGFHMFAGTQLKLITFLFDEDVLVEMFVRRVPPLTRQGNADIGFLLSDDIAYQIAHEAKMISEEGIPPGTGDALNWFRDAITEYQDRGPEMHVYSITTDAGTRNWTAASSWEAFEAHRKNFPDETIQSWKEIN